VTTLYIDRKNVRLACEADALVFHENGERIGTVPLGPLQRIFMRGSVTLDTSLLGRLGSHGIGVVILSGKKAEPSLFLPRAHNDAQRRMAQYRAAADPETCLRIARRIVRAKLDAQARFLRDRLEARLDARYEVSRALRGLTGMMGQVAEKPTIAELRGLEGASANLYFAAYAALAPASVHFHGRNRRPPRDPLNAVLSLGYTLVHAEAVLGAHALGLDPYIGFYHAPAFGRESLASDLVEAMRSQVDAWGLAMFNKQELRAEDFSNTREGCFLGKAGRERFYRAWEPMAENLRKAMEQQVLDLIAMIQPDTSPGQDEAAQPYQAAP
jgi:CRISP-associated protein Cas1